jgi:hypothetical protein
MKTETLIATREQIGSYNCVTTLKDSKGFIKAILTGYQQPKKTQKKIVIRKQMFDLKFT